MDMNTMDTKQPTVTRQIAVKETDYQCAKKIIRLVREFDYLQQHLPKEGNDHSTSVSSSTASSTSS